MESKLTVLASLPREVCEVAGVTVAEHWRLVHTGDTLVLARGYGVEDCLFRSINEACAYARATREAA